MVDMRGVLDALGLVEDAARDVSAVVHVVKRSSDRAVKSGMAPFLLLHALGHDVEEIRVQVGALNAYLDDLEDMVGGEA